MIPEYYNLATYSFSKSNPPDSIQHKRFFTTDSDYDHHLSHDNQVCPVRPLPINIQRTTMLPVRTSKFATCPANHTINLSQLAQNHGGSLMHCHTQPQPYSTRILMPPTKLSDKMLAMPKELVEKMNLVKKVAVSHSTQSKDASRM
jgi:hypothetical protein